MLRLLMKILFASAKKKTKNKNKTKKTTKKKLKISKVALLFK